MQWPMVSPVMVTRDQIWERLGHLAATQENCRPGHVLYTQGELSDRLFFVKKGRVKIAVFHPDGNERVISLVEAGSAFGESAAFDSLPYYATALTVLPSCIWTFKPETVFGAMVEDISVARAVVGALVRKQRVMAMHAEALACMNARARVAMLLACLAEAYGRLLPDGSTVILRLTQDELANFCAVSRITVSRSIRSLMQEGLVVRRKWELHIPDVERLCAFARAG